MIKKLFFIFSLVSIQGIFSAEQKSNAEANLMVEPCEIWTNVAQNKFDKKIFVRQIEDLKKLYGDLNASISNHDMTKDKKLRIATYNIHGFRSPTKGFKDKPGKDFDEIFNVIKDINADVIILQEFSYREPRNKKNTFQLFEQLGYKYHAFAQMPKGSNFGTAILSKLPFSSKPYESNFKNKLNSKDDTRSYAKVEIDLSRFGKAKLAIYGTHLDINQADSDGRRQEEIIELIEAAGKYDKNNIVVIGADFNETKIDKALQILEKGKYKARDFGLRFQDCFAYANLQGPYFSHWTGKVIDYIYLKDSKLNPEIAGCYLYYSAASDHMPIIMDLNLGK